MPFGLDFKSMIIGAIIAYFLVPRILVLFSNAGSSNA